MGDKRVISKTIIESAKFLKMPLSSQMLYIHLMLNADDDGIVEAYPVMQMTKASEDDLKVLHSKNFVFVLNEDLVSFIEDWRIHNSNLRADRKKDSIYKGLLLQLRPEIQLLEKRPRSDVKGVKKSGQSMDGPWTDNGPPKITKDNITKDNIIEDDIDEKIINQILQLYLEICKSYSTVRTLSEKRKEIIIDSLKIYSLDEFKLVFETAEANDYLKGNGKDGWKADFNWLVKADNMAKVLAGSYKTYNTSKKPNSFNNFHQREYDPEEYEKMLLTTSVK